MEELVERRGLLKFISPNVGEICVLVVESLSYLRQLRELLPAARIMVLTEHEESAIKFDDLRLDWIFGNLPESEKVFDIIIAENALTLAYEPYDTLLALSQLLKETGFLVTEFENIRYIGVLENLRQGFFPVRNCRLFAKTEVVRLLNDALFKEINFTADRIKSDNINDWINFGFDNFSDDLAVKKWIIKAQKSTAEVAALKQFYTEDIRKELARLIHRIEYDIDRYENFVRLFKFCADNQIFEDYLLDFVHQIVVHRDVLKIFQMEAIKYNMTLDFE